MKKLLASMVIVAILFSLAACGSGGGERIKDGMYLAENPMVGMAGFSSFEFNGNRVSVGMMNDMMVHTNLRYDFDGSTLTLTIEDSEVNLPTSVVDDNAIIVQGAYFVREGHTRPAAAPAMAPALPTLGQTPGQGSDDETPSPPPVVSLNLPLVLMDANTYIDVGTTTRRDRNVRILDGTLEQYVRQGGAFNAPVEWVEIDTNVRSVYAILEFDRNTFFYIKDDDSLWGWGFNTQGRLGDGTGVNRDEPVHILDDVAVLHFRGNNTVYAITTDMNLYIWGQGIFEPELVKEGIVNIIGSGSMYHHTSGILFEGVRQFDGQVAVSEFLPIPVFDIALQNPFRYINAERELIQRERINRGVHGMVWDDDYVVIAQDVSGLFHITAEFFHNNLFIFMQDGSLWGVGNNARGELGDGTLVPREQPVRITENVVDAGVYFFVTTDGARWTWNQSDPTPQREEVEEVAETEDDEDEYEDDSDEGEDGENNEDEESE